MGDVKNFNDHTDTTQKVPTVKKIVFLMNNSDAFILLACFVKFRGV